MESILISTKAVSRSPRVLASSVESALSHQTRFADLPLPARLLLAVARVRAQGDESSLAERYVLDTLGRIIDAGPERADTIPAVRQFSELLLKPHPLSGKENERNSEWLTSVENLALCVLCQIRANKKESADTLLSPWLNGNSIHQFNSAAQVLCQSDCVKRSGVHAFTPSWTGAENATAGSTKCRSVSQTRQLTLAESIVLNAFRLRARTMNYPKLALKVVPLLRTHLALPRLESLVDAYMVELLRQPETRSGISCLCCNAISTLEARVLSAVAAHAADDPTLLITGLEDWLPEQSVARLESRQEEFRDITRGLGSAIPLRDWDWQELDEQWSHRAECQHSHEPSMIG